MVAKFKFQKRLITNKISWAILVGLLSVPLIVYPALASTLSQSLIATVTGGHYYTGSVYEQTGTQQVQTGTTTENFTCGSLGGYSEAIATGACPSGVTLVFVGLNPTTEIWTFSYTETVPVYTTEPVYGYVPVTEWSPANISYS